MLTYIILGLLNLRPMSGYDIKGWMRSSTGHFWDAKLSQIYTTLKKLEGSGAVRSHMEAQDERPDRRVYEITETGRATLNEWLATMIMDRETKKDPLLVKLFFSNPADKDALIAQLRLQLTLHQEQIRVYQEDSISAIQEFISEQPEFASHIKLWDLTRRFGVMYEETYVQWLQEAIHLLDED